MKKVLSIVFVSSLSALFVSCCPSMEEIEARKKAHDDSVVVIMQQRIDSLVKVTAKTPDANSIAAFAQQQADSLAKLAEAEAATTNEAAAKAGKTH